MAPGFDYVRDPAEIYRLSFEAIRREADLSDLPDAVIPIAERLIHTSGDVDVARHIVFSADAVAAGQTALKAGAPILTDVEMAAHGIIRDRLPAGNKVICRLNDPGVREAARAKGTTRSAAAVDLWRDDLDGAVVVIGNAPTALFRLLEILAEGGPQPALIIGMPVGFVGAVESKEALETHHGGVPYVTLRSRRGGSALAAACLNAIAGGTP